MEYDLNNSDTNIGIKLHNKFARIIKPILLKMFSFSIESPNLDDRVFIFLFFSNFERLFEDNLHELNI